MDTVSPRIIHSVKIHSAFRDNFPYQVIMFSRTVVGDPAEIDLCRFTCRSGFIGSRRDHLSLAVIGNFQQFKPEFSRFQVAARQLFIHRKQSTCIHRHSLHTVCIGKLERRVLWKSFDRKNLLLTVVLHRHSNLLSRFVVVDNA